MTMENDLIRLMDKIVWDPDTSDAEKVKALQGYLYQYGANMDHKTEQMFGDDDSYPYPNMRRC